MPGFECFRGEGTLTLPYFLDLCVVKNKKMKTNYRKVTEKNHIIMEKDTPEEGRMVVLSPGVYKLYDGGNMFLGIIPLFEDIKQGDKLVNFKTGIVARVIEQTDAFLGEESRKAYEELKVAHKMGMLFYGKPGTGKTSTCMLIMKALAEKHSALCLDCTGKSLGFIRYCIERMREIQSNPIVLFIDEFEGRISREEAEYLTFLDGTNSVSNLVFMACTNYIEDIPDRIKKRKSRIKYLHNINSLPEEVYREYLTDRIPTMDRKTLGEFSYKAAEAGLTIDQLKHALIDYKIEKMSIEKAIKTAATFSDDE